MKVVLQRVKKAWVDVDQKTIGRIEQGWLALLGVSGQDTKEKISPLCKKIVEIRGFIKFCLSFS